MKVALIILNWNGKKLLEKFLPTIIAYSAIENVRIYVADNNSSDHSVAFIEKNFPSIVVIKNKENGGYAKGYNEALKQIDADIYGLINSDIEVTKNWLSPIINTFKENSKTAIVQPKILDFKHKTFFEYAGAGGGYIDKFGYPYCRGRIFSELEKDKGQYNNVQDVFWASGACFFIRSSVFKKLKGFDEDYFAHQEEIDLCWRAFNRGFGIKYVGDSTVFHIGGATLKEENSRKTFLNFRNSLFSLIKNLPTRQIIPIVFIRLLLDGVAGIKFILELRPKHCWAIIRAHFSFYFYLPRMIKKRQKNISSNQYYKVVSIVWKHFVLQKKTYPEL